MHRIWKILISLFLVLAAVYYGFVTYVIPGYIKQILPVITNVSKEYLHGSITVGNIVWNGGLTAEVKNVKLLDDKNKRVAFIPQAEVYLKPWLAVIDPMKVVSKVVLDKPEVYLEMNDSKQWNLQHYLKPSESKTTPFYGLIEISKGLLYVDTPFGNWQVDINAVIDGGANPNFSIDAKLIEGENIVAIKGIITDKGNGNLNISSDKLILNKYAAAIQYYAPVKVLEGNLNKIQLNWNGEKDKVKISGQMSVDNLQGFVTYNDKNYDFKLDGKIIAADNVISLSNINVVLDGQQANIEGSADISDLEHIKGDVKITSQHFKWQDFTADNIILEANADAGYINIKKAMADYGQGKVILHGSYNIKDKLLVADADFNDVHQSVGQEIIVANGKGSVMMNLAADMTDLHFAADTFNLKWRTLLINKIAFDGNFIGDKLTIEHLGALADKGSLAAKGTVILDGPVDVDVRMADFPISPIFEFAGNEGSGYCSSGFKIQGTLSNPQFAGIVHLNEVNFMHQHIHEAYGNISVKDKILSIKDFKADMKQGCHTINGYIDFQKQVPYTDLFIETVGVRAEPLIEAVYPEIKLTGNINNVIHLQGPLQQPDISGELYFTDGSVNGYLLDKIQGRYTYNDGYLNLRDFVINALSTEVILNGTMDKNQNLDFTIDTKNFMLERLPVMEKDFDIDGYIDAKGYLRGTLQKPYFTGTISSKAISINGQILTDLEGSMESNGREINKFNISCKQPYDDSGINYGLFKGNLNINIPERYMQGDIVTLWGDLGNILKMCKLDYKLDGIVQGEININQQGKGSGIDINVWADNVKIHDLDYYKMLFKGQLKNGILDLHDVKISERKDDTKGNIILGGQIDFARQIVDLDLQAKKANPAIINLFMQEPLDISGEADMDIKMNGSFDNPSAKCIIDVANGSLSGVSIDNLLTELSLTNDNIKLDKFVASKDIYKITANGDIPVDLFRKKEVRRNINSQMKINVDLQEARLGVLPALTNMVEWADGETKGNVIISGTLEEPLLYGSIKIDGGNVKIKNVDTIISNIQTFTEFKGKNILLHNLSAELGKGTISASGSYALRTNANETYKLTVKADNAQIVSDIFTATVNGNIDILPQKYYDYKTSTPVAYYRPLIQGNINLDNTLINLPVIPDFGEGSSNFGTDVNISLGKDIHLFNKYLYDIWLEGNINLKGSTLFPVIDGNIKAKKGTITYLRTPFKIEKASVAWPVAGTFLPTVNLDSKARFSRYDISMRINGPVEAMDLKLTSNPPLNQNTIIRMLTLQRDSAGPDDVTSEDLQNLMTAGLQLTVLGDVEMLVKQATGLDQFRIYTGKVRSGIGFESAKNKEQELTPEERNQYNLLVSKYINDKLMIGYTTSFDGVDRSIFGQYDINKNLNITYSRSYDLSGKPEDWYGLEYKTTF